MKSIGNIQKKYDPISDADAACAVSVIEGIANEQQQKAFVKLLLYKLCDIDGDCFGEDERQTSFALGRRYVGMQLIRLASTTKG